MSKSNPKELQELIKSKQIVINNKFLVKVSMLDTGAFEKSYLIVVKGLIDNGFKMQYFNNDEEATQFLQMLHLI